jgi:hypothetical protein
MIDALTRLALSACPSDQHARPIAVVREPVSLAQFSGGFRTRQRPLRVAAHLVKKPGVRERQRLAVPVVSSPGERDRVLSTRDRVGLVAEEPQRVRGPRVGEHAKIRTECRTLRMIFIVRGKRFVEILLRRGSSPTLNSVAAIV